MAIDAYQTSVWPQSRDPSPPRHLDQPDSETGTSDEPHDDRCDDRVGDTWAWNSPPANRTAIPYTDQDTVNLIHQAVRDLTIFRAPTGLGDTGATISVLVSLAAEAESQLWDAVTDARDQGYTWNEISDRLATSITTARRRYSAYTTWKKTHSQDND